MLDENELDTLYQLHALEPLWIHDVDTKEPIDWSRLPKLKLLIGKHDLSRPAGVEFHGTI